MCHEVFDYFPTRKVNFLTGVNGSGKSAVMSALIFGLGGGSKITNRGSANKNLIRTGQGQASVEISLYNRGETAYRPVSSFFAIYYVTYSIPIAWIWSSSVLPVLFAVSTVNVSSANYISCLISGYSKNHFQIVLISWRNANDILIFVRFYQKQWK